MYVKASRFSCSALMALGRFLAHRSRATSSPLMRLIAEDCLNDFPPKNKPQNWSTLLLKSVRLWFVFRTDSDSRTVFADFRSSSNIWLFDQIISHSKVIITYIQFSFSFGMIFFWTKVSRISARLPNDLHAVANHRSIFGYYGRLAGIN